MPKLQVITGTTRPTGASEHVTPCVVERAERHEAPAGPSRSTAPVAKGTALAAVFPTREAGPPGQPLRQLERCLIRLALVNHPFSRRRTIVNVAQRHSRPVAHRRRHQPRRGPGATQHPRGPASAAPGANGGSPVHVVRYALRKGGSSGIVTVGALLALILSQATSALNLIVTITGCLTCGFGAALYETRKARQERKPWAHRSGAGPFILAARRSQPGKHALRRWRRGRTFSARR